MKKNYLLIVVVMGLILLSLYSTYAMFTSSVETNNIIDMNAIMNYTFKINGTQELIVSSKSKLRFNAIVQNDMTGKISYGIYYKMINPSILQEGVRVAEITDTTGISKGQLNENSEVTIPIIIENNSDIEIKVEIGVITGYATESQGINQLIYDNGKYPITNTISPSEVDDNNCSSTIKCIKECQPKLVDGKWKNFCLCDTGEEIKNLDTSGANIPDLVKGLIPVMYDGNSWVKADKTNGDVNYQWYDYDNKQWANAVLVSENNRTTYELAEVGTKILENDILAYYVWIPRYKYKLFNAGKEAGIDSYNANTNGIDIVFESGTASTGTVSCTISMNGTESCIEASNGAYYTHPAFTFGNTELTGIWVGKFELTGTSSLTTIKPNTSSLRNLNISKLNMAIANISSDSNTYGLNDSEINSHMMKNMEWGAVAYLSNSKYGRCSNGTCIEIGINNNSSYITGCGASPGSGSSSGCNAYTTANGMLASTTGNVYGIYDMSGGAWEYVMGDMVSSDGKTMQSGYDLSANSGYIGVLYTGGQFTSGVPYPDNKYYDRYPYSSSEVSGNRGHLGDATSEVVISGSKGWNNDLEYFVASNYPWFLRGGYSEGKTDAGVFSFHYLHGGASTVYSSRGVLTRFS